MDDYVHGCFVSAYGDAPDDIGLDAALFEGLFNYDRSLSCSLKVGLPERELEYFSLVHNLTPLLQAKGFGYILLKLNKMVNKVIFITLLPGDYHQLVCDLYN
jgi:hypothetical protein